MAITSRYPSTRPSTSINLNRKKILIPGAKFSRSSVGTYVDENGLIKNAEYNEPRFNYDPETGEFLGLLVEESRTNSTRNSTDLSSTSPYYSGANGGPYTFLTNQTIAPDGTTTAGSIFFTGAYCGFAINYTGVTATTITVSLFAKYITGSANTHVRIQLSPYGGTDNYGLFNLTNGTSSVSGSVSNVIMTPFSDGWYRCSVTATHSTTWPQNSGDIRIWFHGETSTQTPINNTDRTYVWGVQLEAGSFPTSYIPTSGSTVTREADIFELPIKTFKSGRIQYSPEITGNSYYGNIALKDSINTPEYSLEIGSANSLPTISTKFSNVLQSTTSLTKLPSTTTKEFLLSFNFDKDTGKIDFSTPVSDDADASVLELPSESSRKIPSGYSIDTLQVLPGTNIKEVYLWNEELDVNELSSLSEDFASINTQVVETEGYSVNRLDYEDLPSLDLNFARNKSLDDNLSGENLITFTRSSTATYVDSNGVIQTAATDEARFDHDPDTGESLGLLIEESSTNEWSNSVFVFSGSSNPVTNGYTLPGGLTNPAGGTTAVKIPTGVTQTWWSRGSIGFAVTSGDYWTMSWWAYSTNQSVNFGNSDYFSLANTTISQDKTVSAGQWKRCYRTVQFTASGSPQIRFMPYDHTLYTDTNNEVFVWGLQFEKKAFPTSYIPTSGSTVTRAADTASISGTNFSSWYNQSEGTMYSVSRTSYSAHTIWGMEPIWQNRIQREVVTVKGFFTFTPITSSGNFDRIALPIITSAANVPAYRNGLVFNNYSTGSTETATMMHIGMADSRYTQGHISRLTYWPKRLPDTTLQKITSLTVDTFDLVFDSSLDTSGNISIITTGNCTYEVDWGDGSAVETIVASGTFSADHTYIFPSKYIAKINVISGVFRPYYDNSAKADQLVEIRQTPDGWTNTSTSGFGTSLQSAWRGANNLEFIDKGLNISGVNVLDSAWRDASITSFPLLDTSTITSASSSWQNCSNLTSFPQIDTSNVTNFYASWLGCNLLSFPKIDTSSANNVAYAWYGNANLVSFPQLDFSSVLNETDVYKGFSRSWSYCSSLENFPAGCFDNTAGTYFYQAFNFTKLNAESVSNILSSINNANTSDGVLGIFGSGSTTPAGNYEWNSAGWDGFNGLISRNWTIDYIDNLFSSTNTPLDLQFAATKTLDSRITFTRSSTGTYVDSNGVIQTAAVDTARFDHDPDTLESLGLLVEESRTNIAWLATQVYPGLPTIATPNAAVAPDGTFTAWAISSYGFVSNQFGMSYPNYWSLSFFANPGSGAVDVTIQVDSLIQSPVYFNFVTKTFTASGFSYEEYPNGWYKIKYTKNQTSYIGGHSLRSEFRDGSGNTSSGYLWGLQVEEGSFPTSYIPTPATFTSRSTTATYYDANGTIQTAGVDVARDNAYFPDENGVMRPAGLLLEAAETNLLLRSEEFDSASWAIVNGASRTADQTTAPDGTLTADLAAGTSTSSYLQQTVTTSGLTYTMSVYAKAGTLSSFGFGGTGLGTWASFDLSTKTSSANAKIETLPNGWFRCSATQALTSGSIRIILGAGDIYLWGAQLEESSYPTSYIPTSGSTVTRAADVSSSSTQTRASDVVSITGTNFSSWYNQSEGTTFVHLKNIKSQNFSIAPFIAYDGNNNIWDNNQEYGLRYNSSGTTMEAVIRDSSAGFVALTKGGDVRTETKAVIALNSTQFSLTRDGGSVSTVATSGPISSITRFTLSTSAGPRQSTHFSRFTYWPKRLPDGALKYITQ